MQTRRRAAAAALVCAVLSLVIGFSRPMWTVPDDHPRGGTGDRVSLWEALRRLPGEDRRHFWSAHGGDIARVGLRVLIAAGVGVFFYWVARPRRRPLEAADYADGRAGAVPDGRAK